MKRIFIAALMLCIVLFAQFSTAQGLGQSAGSKKLETLVVRVEQDDTKSSLTSLTANDARAVLEKIPGGIGFVELDEYGDQFIQSLGDTLVFTPGVYADTSAQRESRISIRGSGLNATFERRGITVFRDNVPITRASGITEFQEIDPISLKYLEIYKGANAIRLGATSLGGAINAVTPTGHNTTNGTNIRIEGGSFDTIRFNINASDKQDKVDYFASLTKLDSDGFRAHSEVDSVYGFGNVGYAFSDNAETRFYLTAINDQFELASNVSQQDALENPETAVGETFVSPFVGFLVANGGSGTFTAIDDDWDRNLEVTRLSNKTTLLFDSAQLETGIWLSTRELDHAITRFAGIIVQEEDELGFSLRISNDNIQDAKTQWTVGLFANASENDAKTYFNILGERGLLRTDNVQNAENAMLYGQISVPIKESFSLVLGGQYSYAKREEEGSGRLSFNEFNPSIAVLWTLSETIQLYSNISQNYEPPGISDLTAGGVGDFDALDAQKALTIEFGTRGQVDLLAWDISLYHSAVENEFIDTESPVRPNTTITTNSISDTTHQGLEAGLDYYPDIDFLESRGLSFNWRNSYTFNNFSFDDHPIFANNDLAGVPESIYISEFRLESVKNWYAGINVRYIADGPYLDYANTTQVDGYTLFGLTAGWNITQSLRVFISGENINDKNYISNVSTVFEGDATDDNFTPGQGRAYYIGFSLDL